MPPINAADRYRRLIDATLRAALPARINAGPPATINVELALPAIAARMGLIGDDHPALANALARVSAASREVPIVDGAGQTRSTYRPLLIRAVVPFAPIGAFDARDADESIRSFATAGGPILVADGSFVAGVAFEAIASAAIRWRGGEPSTAIAVAALDRLIAGQAGDGTFLARTSSDQLEPAWYHELAVLHAIDVHARRTGDPAARAAVAHSARYHAEQVQPDHASSHPFALAALLEDAEGIHLADMMLHAAGVQQPSTMDAVSLVLLHDAIA